MMLILDEEFLLISPSVRGLKLWLLCNNFARHYTKIVDFRWLLLSFNNQNFKKMFVCM